MEEWIDLCEYDEQEVEVELKIGCNYGKIMMMIEESPQYQQNNNCTDSLEMYRVNYENFCGLWTSTPPLKKRKSMK